MSFVHIKKIQQQDAKRGLIERFAVPSVAIVTPQGKKLIPNPSGQEASVFDSLEEAEAAVRLAGFDSMFEGKKTYNLSHTAAELAPRMTGDRPLDASIPLLLQRLSDREPTVVANAAFALGMLKAQAAIPDLISYLNHDDPAVRKQLADALSRMGSPALPALQKAFESAKTSKDKNAPYVRLTVMNTYAEMTQSQPTLIPLFLPQAVEALNDESWLVKAQAALVIGYAAQSQQNEQERL